MSKLGDVFTDPILRKALFLVSPEAGLIVETAIRLIQIFSNSNNAREKELAELLDHRFAFLVRELANPDISNVAKRELEIRLHELLYILTRWEKK